MDDARVLENLKTQLDQLPPDQALRAGNVVQAIDQLRGAPPLLQQVLLKFHVKVASGISRNFTSLTGWLVAALGAALAHIISNWDTARNLVDVGSLRYTLWLYVWIFACHMLQRVFALFVENCAAGLEVGKDEAMEPLRPEQLNDFWLGVARPYSRPFSFILRTGLAHLRAGNLARVGEQASVASQAVVVLGVLQMALAAVAIWTVARGLG